MRGIKRTAEQNRAKVIAICKAYAEQRVTIKSACDAEAIGVRQFTDLCASNADYAELYKKAQAEHSALYMAGLKEKAKTALEKLIDGFEYEEVIQEGEMDATGKFIPGKVKRVKRRMAPNPAATIFALTNSDPTHFKNRHFNELTGSNGKPIEYKDATLDGMSVEKLFILKHGRKPKKGELDI